MQKIKCNSLQEYKDYYNLTGGQIADLIQVDRQWAYMLLWGKVIPSSRLAKLIHERCGIPLDNLLYPKTEKGNKENGNE